MTNLRVKEDTAVHIFGQAIWNKREENGCSIFKECAEDCD